MRLVGEANNHRTNSLHPQGKADIDRFGGDCQATAGQASAFEKRGKASFRLWLLVYQTAGEACRCRKNQGRGVKICFLILLGSATVQRPSSASVTSHANVT